jgi:hypothetical protein
MACALAFHPGPAEVRADVSRPPARTSAGEQIVAQVGAEAAVGYLLSHEKPNGAFGPAGHNHTDLAWNYPAVHALVLLGQVVPRPEDCYRHGRGAIYKERGTHNHNWAWDIYQRAQLAAVLGRKGEDGVGLSGVWTVEYQDREANYYFRIPDAKLQSRVAPFCDIPTLAYFVEAITVSGGRIGNPEVARDYVLARQVASGAVVDAYRVEDSVEEQAHVLATAQAVFVLQALGFEVPRREACVRWLQSCQDSSGGFRWSPSNSAASNQPDVWYTWAAVRALRALDAEPADPARSAAWINSLQNPDGGFGDRPGWNSRLYSTYYAVHALDALAGEAKSAIQDKEAFSWQRRIPPGEYSIFQAHLKSPPGGPEMVEAAVKMGFHFLAVKDNSPGTEPIPAKTARAYALEKKHRLEIVSCPEQYGHRLKWHGGHPAHHVANYLIPPDLAPEAQARLDAADRAGRSGLPWAEYRERVIAPITALGALFYPELDYEMMNAYMVYDDGLDGGPGYNAVIGALGWPLWDWIRFFPYRERWVGKLPIVADGDAHGDVVKWKEPLDRQRMLYIARTHDRAGFLEACREGRTVCVIRGGADKTELAFYGEPAAVEYVKERRREWQWWE